MPKRARSMSKTEDEAARQLHDQALDAALELTCFINDELRRQLCGALGETFSSGH